MKRMPNYANKGRAFEEQITAACQYYRQAGIATILKVATPWVVIRKGPRIVNAFPSGPSTVDYMGDFNGHSIAFEAKTTSGKTSVPLSLFEAHQIEFLSAWRGTAFALVEASAHHAIRRISIGELLPWWTGAYGRKSIPMDTFLRYPKVELSTHGHLDFLKGVME